MPLSSNNSTNKICLKRNPPRKYIRVAEDCETRRNLGLICKSNGEFWLWVKKEPSESGAVLYSAKDRSAFKPYMNNPDSTPRGGSGYLGGRKFSDFTGVKVYLRKIAPVVLR